MCACVQPVAEEVLQEIEILKYLQHKNLVKLCEIIDDPTSKHLYIIMEYVPAGPIMIRESANGNFISRLGVIGINGLKDIQRFNECIGIFAYQPYRAS